MREKSRSELMQMITNAEESLEGINMVAHAIGYGRRVRVIVSVEDEGMVDRVYPQSSYGPEYYYFCPARNALILNEDLPTAAHRHRVPFEMQVPIDLDEAHTYRILGLLTTGAKEFKETIQAKVESKSKADA